MSITLRAFGRDNTIWNFLDENNGGPDWASLSISEGTTNEVTCRFSFEGSDVVFRLNGNFPEVALSTGILSALAGLGATVTGYEILLRDTLIESASMSSPLALSDLLAGFEANDLAALSKNFAGNDVFYGSAQGNADGDQDGAHGYGGNDTFYGNAYSTGNATNHDKFYGGEGIDTAVFQGSAAQYQVRWSDFVWMPNGLEGSGYEVTDTLAGRDGTKALRTVERLKFSDKSVALDIDAGGSALKTMQIVSLVVPSLADDLSLRGKVLSIFDTSVSMRDFSQLVVNAGLLPSGNSDFIATLYATIFHKPPAADELAALTKYADDVGQAGVLAQVAEMSLTVNLVGLQQNGMDYIL